MLTLGLHRLYLWRPDGKPTGKLFANVVLASCVFYFVMDLVHFGQGVLIGPTDFTVARRRITTQLEATSGGHLVLVRYAPEHNLHNEWVYNRADIDASKIVWAREMNPSQDKALLDYYRERRVWLLEADLQPPKLSVIQ
jgi:hypothetical protein